MRRATVLSCRLSVFREIPEASWVAANDLAFAFRDRFPVSRGHTLVVTRRVTPDWFSASADERTAILALVEAVKKQLDEEFIPTATTSGSTRARRRARPSCTSTCTSSRGSRATWTTRGVAFGM